MKLETFYVARLELSLEDDFSRDLIAARMRNEILKFIILFDQ